MNITRYNPFDFAAVQALRFLDQALLHASEPSTSRSRTPAVDILETENDLVIKADLPEVKQEQIDIRVENGALTLKGGLNAATAPLVEPLPFRTRSARMAFEPTSRTRTHCDVAQEGSGQTPPDQGGSQQLTRFS